MDQGAVGGGRSRPDLERRRSGIPWRRLGHGAGDLAAKHGHGGSCAIGQAVVAWARAREEEAVVVAVGCCRFRDPRARVLNGWRWRWCGGYEFGKEKVRVN